MVTMYIQHFMLQILQRLIDIDNMYLKENYRDENSRIPSYTNTFEEADFGHLKIIFLQYFLRFELIQNCRIDRRWNRAYLAYCPAIRYCSFHQCFAQ